MVEKKLEAISEARLRELARLREELTRAREKLGSQKDKLQWYLNFAENDLNGLSPTEKTLEGYKLLAAASHEGFPGEDDWPTKKPVEPIRPAILRAVQREITKALNCLFSDAAWWCPPGYNRVEITRTSQKGAKEARFEISFRTYRDLGFVMQGFVRALLDGGKDLRTCIRCNKPFVATKRQEYCSLNCSQIVRNDKKKRIRGGKRA
jgi:hypothetical protein